MSAYFVDIVRYVDAILDSLPFVGTKQRNTDIGRQVILDTTISLMGKMCSLQEYLGNVVLTLSDGSRPEERSAQGLSKRLEGEINHLFKVPVNKVKHDGFRLCWLEQTCGDECIKGFYVQGLVAPKTRGPAPRRFGTRAIAEGYSFPYFLRVAFETVYRLCSQAEDALQHRLVGKPTSTFPLKLAGSVTLATMLAKLNAQPMRGFPNEHGERVLVLECQESAVVVARTATIHRFRHASEFSTELGITQSGESALMPYWTAR